MLNFLNMLVIKNTKQGLKILMDRWLLHQPRFIGKLTKNSTFEALMSIFASRNPIFSHLLVLGYDPSHTKHSPEVYVPLKILSTLIRCYENENKCTHKDQRVSLNDKADEVYDQLRMKMDPNQEDGRLATYDEDDNDIDGDQDPDMNGFDDELDVNPIHQVHVNIQPDFEDLNFGGMQQKKNRANGFKNLEVTSMSGSYMSDMLGFDDADNGECDPATEEDLRCLGGSSLDFDLASRIKGFIEGMIDKDPGYMSECFAKLCPKDLKMLKNDLKVKIS